MNEYNIKVNFVKGQILTNLKKLVQNDYNTTKLNFTFDKEGRVLFKMLYPDGTQYVDEIQNNELIFGKGVLNQEGTYEYEISLYSEDGRLTDYAVKSFEVRSELVDTDEIVEPDDRVPVLDNLINEVSTIKQDVEDGKYNGKDGIDGKDGITPAIGENGNWFIDGVDTGMSSQGTEGPQGPAGGLSLEEVETITGKLENLGTEDKSNLVNAINEVMNSGGSFYEYMETSSDNFVTNGQYVGFTGTIDRTNFINAILKVTDNSSKTGAILVRDRGYNSITMFEVKLGTIGGSNGKTAITLKYFSFSPIGSYKGYEHDFYTGYGELLITTENEWSKLTTTTVKYDFSEMATKSYVDEAIANLKTELAGAE